MRCLHVEIRWILENRPERGKIARGEGKVHGARVSCLSIMKVCKYFSALLEILIHLRLHKMFGLCDPILWPLGHEGQLFGSMTTVMAVIHVLMLGGSIGLDSSHNRLNL